MEKKIMEQVNNEVVCETANNSKGGLVVKIAALAIGAVAAVGTALFLKKRKANAELDSEVIEPEDK